MEDKFLEDNASLIRDLADKFQTHYNRPNQEKIEGYLKQFQNPRWMKLALKLLQNIDYVDDGKILDMFREFYYNKLNEDKRKQAVFTILGGLQDSSSHIIYLCSKALGEGEKKGIKFQNLKDAIKTRKPQETTLIFVDDNIGSGKQAIRIFEEWLGVAEGQHEYVSKLKENEIQWMKETELIYFVFIGFREGMDALREELKKHGLSIFIFPAKETSEYDRCLEAGSLIFDNEEDRKEAIEMARTIGYELLKDKNWSDDLRKQRALGYGNSQKLIIFSYNTPTCTLPILWKWGTYHARRWQPLFPRREQKVPDIGHLKEEEQQYKIIEGEIFNPYKFEGSATKDQFYGRKIELKRLLDAIKEGRSVIIYGLQRIGKTSLVEEALDVEVKREGYEVIDLRIDMQTSYENFNTYTDFFMTTINTLCDKFSIADSETFRNEVSKYLRQRSEQWELRRGFMKILDLAKKKLGNKPLLFFIDEFQEISKSFESAKNKRGLINPIDSELVRYISSLAKKGLLQLLFCCRYQIIGMDSRLNFQLLKIMREIELLPLDNESAKALIQNPVRNSITYEEPALEKILVLTGGNPFLIQYMCFELVEKIKVTRIGLIKEKDVDEIAEMMISEVVREPKFKLLYEDFQQIENGIPWKILLSIAQLAEQCRETVEWNKIRKICAEELRVKTSTHDYQHAFKILKASQIVGEKRKGDIISYLITPDILRQWLRRQNLFHKEIVIG